MGAMATETPAAQPAYRVVGITEETRADFLEVDHLTWFDEVDPTDPDWSRCLDLSRAFAATETSDPPFAGIYGSFDMGITIPAPEGRVTPVPMAGLTWVGVHPDHRRRGVLTAMLDHHFRRRARHRPEQGHHAATRQLRWQLARDHDVPHRLAAQRRPPSGACDQPRRDAA